MIYNSTCCPQTLFFSLRSYFYYCSNSVHYCENRFHSFFSSAAQVFTIFTYSQSRLHHFTGLEVINNIITFPFFYKSSSETLILFYTSIAVAPKRESLASCLGYPLRRLATYYLLSSVVLLRLLRSL